MAAPAFAQDEIRPPFGFPQGLARPYDRSANLAYSGNGFARPAVARDRIQCCFEIHAPEFANDGYYGNGASWISGSGAAG